MEKLVEYQLAQEQVDDRGLQRLTKRELELTAQPCAGDIGTFASSDSSIIRSSKRIRNRASLSGQNSSGVLDASKLHAGSINEDWLLSSEPESNYRIYNAASFDEDWLPSSEPDIDAGADHTCRSCDPKSKGDSCSDMAGSAYNDVGSDELELPIRLDNGRRPSGHSVDWGFLDRPVLLECVKPRLLDPKDRQLTANAASAEVPESDAGIDNVVGFNPSVQIDRLGDTSFQAWLEDGYIRMLRNQHEYSASDISAFGKIVCTKYYKFISQEKTVANVNSSKDMAIEPSDATRILESRKRPRAQKQEEPTEASKYLIDYNIRNPVSDNDQNMMRFQDMLKGYLTALCNWACDGTTASRRIWAKQSQHNREMTISARKMLQHVGRDTLFQLSVQSIPRKVQQVIGNPRLQLSHLLDLEDIDESFVNWGVYANIPVRLPKEKVVHVDLCSRYNRQKRVAEAGSLSLALDTRIYIGSSRASGGLFQRVYQHNLESSKVYNGSSVQYQFTSQLDVVNHFKALCVTDNASMRAANAPSLPYAHSLPLFLESVFMAIFNVIHTNWPEQCLHQAFINDYAVGLIRDCRRAAASEYNYSLPDFSSASTNVAWPMLQGLSTSWVSSADASVINTLWLQSGIDKRVCFNCNVQIPTSAHLYGLGAGIRCQRCHNYARKKKSEWPIVCAHTHHGTMLCGCSVCGEPLIDPKCWANGDLLCIPCYTRRCCYGQDQIPIQISDSFALCVNPACRSWYKQTQSTAGIIEDTENHLWRCLRCDWEYSCRDEFGNEKEPLPIAHHTDNDIQCEKCERYATPGAWFEQANGNMKCSLCHARCANQFCRTDPMDLDNLIQYFPLLNVFYCKRCAMKQKRAHRKDSSTELSVSFGIYGKIAAENNIDCGNCGLLITGEVRFANNKTGIPEYARCMTCMSHLNIKGEERPQSLYGKQYRSKPEDQTCVNCQVKNATKYVIAQDHSGRLRCEVCHVYWRANGKDRPEFLHKRAMPKRDKKVCCNCGTTSAKIYSAAKDRLGYLRCVTCTSYKRRVGIERPSTLWTSTEEERKIAQEMMKGDLETG